MTQQERDDENAALDYWLSVSLSDTNKDITDAFLAGIAHARKEQSEYVKALEQVAEAAKIGAFHHIACPWHDAGPCYCAKGRVIEALAALEKEKGER